MKVTKVLSVEGMTAGGFIPIDQVVLMATLEGEKFDRVARLVESGTLKLEPLSTDNFDLVSYGIQYETEWDAEKGDGYFIATDTKGEWKFVEES